MVVVANKRDRGSSHKDLLSWCLITKLKETIEAGLPNTPRSSHTDLLSWYLISIKLKETKEAGLANTPRSIGSPRPPQQQHPQPSEPPQVVGINGKIKNHKPIQPHANNSWESEWVISIKEKLKQAPQDESRSSWSQLCIYRVPRRLRDLADDKAYIPQVVSLGPYHHGETALQEMEPHKWRALRRMLNRTRQDIDIYLDSMKKLEGKARACYEQPVSLSRDRFVDIMVLDGCFVLELFMGVEKGFPDLGYSRNDPVFAKRDTMHSIKRDMIMLENQIPLFVLDKLLGLQLGNPDQKGHVSRLALKFFHPLTPTPTPTEQQTVSIFPFDPLSFQGSLHCLDVFRISLLRQAAQPASSELLKPPPPRYNPAADESRQQLVHCATNLKNAGIKFKQMRTDRFWDIEFDDDNGVLKIPRLLVDDGTKSLFFNLIAFEQCHLDCTNNVTSYVVFMDNLINSAEDVGYLRSRGIIEHWLGNDTEVADLFNKMCREVVFHGDNSYLSELSTKVNNYYKNPLNHWRKILKSKYFNNPWAIISFVAAVFLLLLTFAQSFYGVYGYYRPSS